MFADIVGFTNFSSTRTPHEVVAALSELFSRFDTLCEENLCYKVCTIGDCYVALGWNGEEKSMLRQPKKELLNILRLSN